MAGAGSEERKLYEEEGRQKGRREQIARTVKFILESDEEHFFQVIKGLSRQEIEEYLEEFPEFRKYWENRKNLYGF